MLTTCPKCRQSYVGKSCPRCAPALPASAAQRAAVPWDNPLTPGHWSQNPWVRCAVGVAVSQGLFLGMRRWAEAAVSFFGPGDLSLEWAGTAGFLGWGALQCLCVVVGSMLVGAGQREWLFYGLAVGFINTVIDLALGGARFKDTDPLFIAGLMTTSFAAGVLGSRIGSAIWRPLESYRPTLEIGSGAKRGGIAVKDLFAGINFLSLKVNWFRILLGSAIGVAAPPFARTIFFSVVRSLGLRGMIEDNINFQTNVFLTLIRVLAVFLAGFIAGSNSTNGPAHGFWAGLLTSAGMVTYRWFQSTLPNGDPFVFEEVLAYAFGYMGLCIFGAIFGSRLLPPVLHTGKRKVSKRAEI